MRDADVLVIGSGPGGQEAAVAALDATNKMRHIVSLRD
jgi:pyruvate/2-oxoglutarate dehydrogenase complex dihydrolipoamide dehydrogenase (E3) component